MSANDSQVGGSHYKDRPVQTWDFIHRNGIGFLAGCVIKYLVRHKQKGGIVDLKKAQHYLEKLIEEEELASKTAPPACRCSPADRDFQSRGLLLRHVKACPLRGYPL